MRPESVQEKRSWKREPINLLYSKLGGQSMTAAWAVFTAVCVFSLLEGFSPLYAGRQLDFFGVDVVTGFGLFQALVMGRAALVDREKRLKNGNGGNESSVPTGPAPKADL